MYKLDSKFPGVAAHVERLVNFRTVRKNLFGEIKTANIKCKREK